MRSRSAFIDSSGSKYAGSGSYSTSISSSAFSAVGFVHGGDAGHVIAHVADLVHGQRGLVVADGQDAVLVGRVLAGDDGNHAFERQRAARVNALDARVRIGRVQNLADEHAGKREVVGVLAGACGFAGGIDHRDAFADD